MNLYSKILKKTKDHLPKRRHFGRNTIVHRDPHALNFILTNDELMLLDWELCHLNHKTVDIVYYCRTISEEDEKIFMETYGYEDDKLALWLQWMEQCAGGLGFYINIYNVAKSQNLSLPNLGDHHAIRKKLDREIQKLENRIDLF